MYLQNLCHELMTNPVSFYSTSALQYKQKANSGLARKVRVMKVWPS